MNTHENPTLYREKSGLQPYTIFLATSTRHFGEVIGTSASTLKKMSCLVVDLIVLYAWQASENRKYKENMNLHFYLRPSTITKVKC